MVDAKLLFVLLTAKPVLPSWRMLLLVEHFCAWPVDSLHARGLGCLEPATAQSVGTELMERRKGLGFLSLLNALNHSDGLRKNELWLRGDRVSRKKRPDDWFILWGSACWTSSRQNDWGAAGDEDSIPTHIFPSCEPNALASGVGSGFRSGVARSSGILLMPDASANGSQAWPQFLRASRFPPASYVRWPAFVAITSVRLSCPIFGLPTSVADPSTN